MKPAQTTWIFLIVAACLLGMGLPTTAQEPAENVLNGLRELLGEPGPRYPGSEVNLRLQEKVATTFAESGYTNGAVEMASPRLLPGPASLRTAGGEYPIHAMHPTLVRPGNFAQNSFTTRLIYLGQGEDQDLTRLAGTTLEDAILVLDYDTNYNWERFLRFAPAGFLFIGRGNYAWQEARSKIYTSESSTPRYYLQESAADRLLAEFEAADGKPLEVQVSAEHTRWERTLLKSPWVFIPGSDPDIQKRVIVITAPLDSNSVVPDLAYGGQAALNLYALMELFERFSESPPSHSVLLVANNAHTLGFLGPRELAWNLLAPMSDIQASRGQLAEEIRLHDMFLKEYEVIDFSQPVEELQAIFEGFRTKIDNTTGRRVTVKDPIVALARRDVNESKARRVHLLRQEMPEEEMQQRLDALDARKQKYVNVLTLFNRVGQKTEFRELAAEGREEELDILKGYVETIVTRYRTWADLNHAELERSRRSTEIRTALEGRKVAIVIQLDVNWVGDSIGFASQQQENWVRRFGLKSSQLALELEEQRGATPGSIYVDAITKVGGLSEHYYYQQSDYGLDHYHASEGTPAVSLRSVHAPHGRAFSPDDTIANLDRQNVQEQFPFVLDHLTAIANDPEISSPQNLGKPKADRPIWASRIKTFKFDEFSASVLPQLPVPGTMIMLIEAERHDYDYKEPLVSGDVINAYIAITDARASELVVGMNSRGYVADAYQFDDTGSHIEHVMDVGDIVERADPNLVPSDMVKHLAMFVCQEFRIPSRHVSANIGDDWIAVRDVIVLEARQNSAPRKYGIAGVRSLLSTKQARRSLHGPISVFLEGDDRLKLVTQSKQTIINSTREAPEGLGFASEEGIGAAVMVQSAQDLKLLNEYRLQRMAGVTNQLAEDFALRGAKALESLEVAESQQQHGEVMRLSAEALGAQDKAYTEISSMGNDMLKAVVFYVALLLPFCFFIQKLLFKFVKIEAQMGAFAALFVLAFVLFRFIHPAFKMTEAAEAIFIAFVMMALGSFVIWVLHKRFEGEMQALFQSYLGVTAEVGYSTVGQKAMMIGVNNMKRRRIRTGLTTATIVLITFAMLAFSSVSKKASPTIIPKDVQPAYTGLFYSWPGSLRMGEATLREVISLFENEAERIAVRRWVKSLTDSPVIGLVTERGGQLPLEAVLGVQPADEFLLREEGFPVLPGGRFFSGNDAREVLLPLGLAKALELDESVIGQESVRILGMDLLIVGFLDDDELRDMVDLNTHSILPIKDVERLGFRESERSASMRVDPAEEGEGTVFFVETASMCVIPEGTAQDMGGEPYSISIELRENASPWLAIDRMLTATKAKFFVGSQADFEVPDTGRSVKNGVYFVGSGYKTSIGGLSRLIIPLLIAGTIILNTMLGSVYERKYEIAVYNAIGLNPTHIGMFFLAEAFVYSVIGSVGGYLIGQMLAMGLINMDLVGGLNLNFSSLVVVYVILFTIAVVLLSTLYPAYAATRAAVPSGKRKWSLPDHDGKEMEVVFPFIYQQKVAVGIMGYLEQYFSRFTEASVGELISKPLKYEHRKDEQGRDIYRSIYDVALAPYDLGVTQIVEFRLSYDDEVQSYRLHMYVRRQSGQDSNWVTTNKPFLEKMRKYLIQWRNMEPAQHMVYVSNADSLYADEQPNPTPAESTT